MMNVRLDGQIGGALRAAIVGCGRMGGFVDDEAHDQGMWTPWMLPASHGLAYWESPHTTLVAGCDVVAAARNRFAERYGGTQVFSDVEEMMAAVEPDLVSITTRTDARVEAAMTAISHKPRLVFLEKPMAQTLADADTILAAAEEHDVLVAVNCARRWHPIWHRGRELIEAGLIGDPLAVTAYCGGGLSHMGSHLMDTVRYLIGDPQPEWVTGHVHDEEALAEERDTGGVGFFGMDNGVHLHVNMLDAAAVGFEVDVVGGKGRIRIGGNGKEAELWTKEGARGREMVQHVFPVPARVKGFALVAIDDFVQAIAERRAPRCSGRDGRAVLEMAVGLRHSVRNGGAPVSFPLDEVSRAMRIQSA